MGAPTPLLVRSTWGLRLPLLPATMFPEGSAHVVGRPRAGEPVRGESHWTLRQHISEDPRDPSFELSVQTFLCQDMCLASQGRVEVARKAPREAWFPRSRRPPRSR